MSKRYNRTIAQLNALVRELEDISAITPAVDAVALAEQIKQIIINTRGKQDGIAALDTLTP